MKQFFTKRRILILVVIVLLIAIALLLFLPGRGRKEKRFQGGEDTPYPYEWTEKKDGSILFSLCAHVPEGCVWRTEQDENETALVKRDEKEDHLFRLQPRKDGDVLLRFTLADKTFPEDRCCELLLTVEVRSEKKSVNATVVGHRLVLAERALRGGESFGCPYRLWTDEQGRFTVGLAEDSQEQDWQLFQQNSGNVLRFYGLRTENGVLSLRFRGVSAGVSRLCLYSAARRLTLELSLASDEDGTVTVESHNMAAHPEWEGLKADELEAYVVAGDIHMPEGAENVSYSRHTLGKQMEAAVVSFRYLDTDWTVYVVLGSELEEQIAKEFEYETIRTLAVSGHVMHACLREEEGTVTAWFSVGERWFLIEGADGADLAKLLDTANALITEATQ